MRTSLKILCYLNKLRLSASQKILIYLVFALSLFLFKSLLLSLFLISLVFSILLFHPYKRLRQGILPISIFVTSTFLSSLFFYPGKVVFEAGLLSITDHSLSLATIRAVRVGALIFGARLLTLTTPMEDILKSLRKTFLPLERIKIPVNDFFDTATFALYLIPQVRDKVVENYRQGISSLPNTDFFHRFKLVVTLIIPVVVQSLQSPGDFLTKNSIFYSKDEGKIAQGVTSWQ